MEQEVAELTRERAELAAHLQSAILSDEQIAAIESFCTEVCKGFDSATFEDKRRYFELLDVRGRLALENDDKVVYVKCKLGEQRLLQIPISRSSSNQNVTPIIIAARLVIGRAQPAELRQSLLLLNTNESP